MKIKYYASASTNWPFVGRSLAGAQPHTVRRKAWACCRESAPGCVVCDAVMFSVCTQRPWKADMQSAIHVTACAHAVVQRTCRVYMHICSVCMQCAWEVHAVRGELRVAEAARVGVHHLDAQLRDG